MAFFSPRRNLVSEHLLLYRHHAEIPNSHIFQLQLRSASFALAQRVPEDKARGTGLGPALKIETGLQRESKQVSADALRHAL